MARFVALTNGPVRRPDELFVPMAINFLVNAVMVVAYIVLMLRNRILSARAKGLWALGMLILGPNVMLAYWWIHIWNSPTVSAKHSIGVQG